MYAGGSAAAGGGGAVGGKEEVTSYAPSSDGGSAFSKPPAPSSTLLNVPPPQPISSSVHEYIYRMQSMISNLEVKLSVLGDFNGLFVSHNPVKEGEVICTYEGSVLNTKEAMRLADKSYLMRLGPQVYVDTKNHLHCLARFINDCVNPAGHNVKFVKLPDKLKAEVVATRDIYPGEEVYVDYGKWYWLGSKMSAISQNSGGNSSAVEDPAESDTIIVATASSSSKTTTTAATTNINSLDIDPSSFTDIPKVPSTSAAIIFTPQIPPVRLSFSAINDMRESRKAEYVYKMMTQKISETILSDS